MHVLWFISGLPVTLTKSGLYPFLISFLLDAVMQVRPIQHTCTHARTTHTYTTRTHTHTIHTHTHTHTCSQAHSQLMSNINASSVYTFSKWLFMHVCQAKSYYNITLTTLNRHIYKICFPTCIVGFIVVVAVAYFSVFKHNYEHTYRYILQAYTSIYATCNSKTQQKKNACHKP